MSCITVPKTWSGSASPRVEAVSPVLSGAIVQRRATKKARATPKLVDTVREVVQAFEFEYAQVRAEAVELKGVLDDRRTQLSDLRRHLEKESSENGTLEAVVEHRNSKNDTGDGRLRELEGQFTQIPKVDRVIASRAAALESDLGLFTQEHRHVRETINRAVSQLDHAEATLGKRECALASRLQESESLSAAVQEERRKVEERQSLLQTKQETTSKARSLTKETAAEAAALEADVERIRQELTSKEAESAKASLGAGEIRLHREETLKTIGENRATSAQDLRSAHTRMGELKKQVDTIDRANVELEAQIDVVQQAVIAETETHDIKRGEIVTAEARRKEAVEAETCLLSEQLNNIDAEVTQAEGAVGQASDRIKQANTEFSNLMAAMSAAFRDYDQAVTENRELEVKVAESKNALDAVRERSQRDVSALRENRDNLASANAEDRAATAANLSRTEELAGILRDTQKAVSEASSSIDIGEKNIAACNHRLQEGLTRKHAEEQGRAKALEAAKEAETAAQEALKVARARHEDCKSGFLDVGRQAAEWTLPPVALSEADLQRADEEAEAAVHSMRAGDDEAHSKRLRSHEETLTTIREGGAIKLKAEKDAAAARLVVLQDQVLDTSRSLADLRARSKAAHHAETAITLELDRRELEERRAADEVEASATIGAGAGSKSDTVQGTATQDAPAEDVTAEATPSSFATPNDFPTSCPSDAHRPHARSLGRTRTQAPGGGPVVSGGPAPAFSTPDVRPTNRSSSEMRPSKDARPVPRGAVQTSEREDIAADGGLQHDSYEVRPRAEPTPRRSHSDHRPTEPARRSKKGGRSSSKEPPVRSQQASESTAEAAGSASSERRHNSGHNGNINGRTKHKKKDKSSARASSKSTERSSKSGHVRSHANDDSSVHPRTDSSRKGSSKSRSRSPRQRPMSPRPADKEYDLWTDNRLVGDSDFSFF